MVNDELGEVVREHLYAGEGYGKKAMQSLTFSVVDFTTSFFIDRQVALRCVNHLLAMFSELDSIMTGVRPLTRHPRPSCSDARLRLRIVGITMQGTTRQ